MSPEHLLGSESFDSLTKLRPASYVSIKEFPAGSVTFRRNTQFNDHGNAPPTENYSIFVQVCFQYSHDSVGDAARISDLI